MAPVERPQITVNGLRITKLFDYVQRSSISEFQDSFTLTVGGDDKEWTQFKPDAVISTVFLGASSSFKIDDRRIDTKGDGEIKIQCIGESAEYLQYLNNAEPKKYVKTTDDSILADIGMSVQSDGAVKIDEFSIQAGEKVLDVAKRLAYRSGFLLYTTQGGIYKKRIGSGGASGKTYYKGADLNEISTTAIHVLDSISFSESTKHCASDLVAYSQSGDYKNIKSNTSVSLNLVLSGGSVSTNRKEYLKVDASDVGELQGIIDDNVRKFKPIELISFRVKGNDNVKLNTTAIIKFDRYNINATMCLYAKEFSMKSNGEMTTTLQFCRPDGTYR